MKEPDIAVYVQVMEEIKKRTEVVYAFLDGRLSAMYKLTQIETMCLQIRMILELIALASLAANKAVFEESRLKFHKHWHPEKILGDIERLNPGYYPQPVKETPSIHPGAKSDIISVKEGFLTKQDLVETHGRLGGILHARNPFGKNSDPKTFRDSIPDLMAKINLLLNSHQIRLLGDQDFFYLIHMKERGDNWVHYYKFGKVTKH